MTTLAGLTMLMSGGSRGIGLAIATRAARDGANVVMLAKTAEPQPRLEGTVHTAAAHIQEAGGQALAVVGDVRNDDDVGKAVDAAVDRFGGVDIVVNNASALDLRPTREIDMKKYDLMQDINARGTFLLSKTAIPHLERSSHAHVLTLGALDLLARATSSFTDESEHVGLLLASHAAIAAADAQHLEHVTSALVNRDIIGQAKGILMERLKITSNQAFAVLAKVSQDTNRKLSAVAEDLTRTGIWTPGRRAGHDRQDTP